MTDFTVDDLIREVHRLAEEQPDYVYETPSEYMVCQYVHGTEVGELVPGCIMGHALVNLGVPADRLRSSQGIRGLVANLVDPEVKTNWKGWWLELVQVKQDSHRPWGEAVAQADVQLRIQRNMKVPPR